MRSILILFFCMLHTQQVFSAPNTPVKHTHNGRSHSHSLPKVGILHNHNTKSIKKASLQKGITIRVLRNSTINTGYGHYSSNTLLVEPIKGTRKVKLLETLIFTEPNGKKWVAPKGHIVDGASIPKFFQPVIGKPYGGKYVMASVIHDVACDQKENKWRDVHKVFYYAMLASGVTKSKANLMYNAVYRGGPRWGADAEKVLSKTEFKALVSKGYFQELESDFNKEDNISLDIIGQLKAYNGVAVYSGTTNKTGSSFVGGTIRINDLSFTAHSDLSKKGKSEKYKVTYDHNDKLKLRFSVDKEAGVKTLGFGVTFGDNSAIGSTGMLESINRQTKK